MLKLHMKNCAVTPFIRWQSLSLATGGELLSPAGVLFSQAPASEPLTNRQKLPFEKSKQQFFMLRARLRHILPCWDIQFGTKIEHLKMISVKVDNLRLIL